MIEGPLSPTHLLLLLSVALIVLGPKRLPQAGRGLGSAIRGFKESLTDWATGTIGQAVAVRSAR